MNSYLLCCNLSMELHLFEFSERSELFIHLIDSSWDELILICEGLKNTFADLYLECDRGREKFSTFQVKWQSMVSVSAWCIYILCHDRNFLCFGEVLLNCGSNKSTPLPFIIHGHL